MEFTAGEIFSAIGTVLLMIAVFVGAYYVSKLVGRGYLVQSKSSAGRHLSVLESTPVGKDSAVVVIKAGERVFLIGTTPRELTFLSELDAESFPDAPEQTVPKQSFLSVLKSVTPGKKNGSGEGEN